VVRIQKANMSTQEQRAKSTTKFKGSKASNSQSQESMNFDRWAAAVRQEMIAALQKRGRRSI
jgi:hypothetical protein